MIAGSCPQGVEQLLEERESIATEVSNAVAPCFKRREQHQRALEYIEGLLSSAPRKNSWQLAEQIGLSNPYPYQNLLGRSQWDADQLRDCLYDYVRQQWPANEATLIIDETGFLKKGRASAGVERQYSGTAGRIENCQIGVFSAYTTHQLSILIDRELYVPKSWVEAPQRCHLAKIPEGLGFATKPKLARVLVERALENQLPVNWVVADCVYSGYHFRFWLEQQGIQYVLGVTSTSKFCAGFSQPQTKLRFEQLAPEQWTVLSQGDGLKGKRVYQWARLAINGSTHPDYQRWLLARRSLDSPHQIAYFLVWAASDLSLAQLVAKAGERWQIETAFKTAKQEVGLDEYQVRSWQGWYRHITLSLWAYAMLLRCQGWFNGKRSPSTLKKGRTTMKEFKMTRGLLG